MSNEAMNYARQLQLFIPARKLIMYVLADRADQDFSCYPSIPLLAAECEVLPRQVKRHLAWLRQNGYISDRECFRPNGSQTVNRYYLHGPWDDYGGSGYPPPTIILPGRTNPEKNPFRKGTRAAGGVSSETPPRGVFRDTGGVSSTTQGGRPERHRGGVPKITPGMSSEPPPGDGQQDTPGVVAETSPEPPVEPSVGTLTRTQGSSSVGTVTVPAARGGDWEEDKDALTGVLTPAVREALDLLQRVPAPAGRRGMTYTEMLELVPLVVRCLGEPWPWSKIELLHELSRDLGDVRNVQRLALDRLKKLDPLRLPEDGGLWAHERPARPVRQVLVPCLECARPMKGDAPADGLCQDCRTEMARAVDAAVSGGAGVDQVDLVDVDGHDQVPGQLGVPLADDLVEGTAEDPAG